MLRIDSEVRGVFLVAVAMVNRNFWAPLIIVVLHALNSRVNLLRVDKRTQFSRSETENSWDSHRKVSQLRVQVELVESPYWNKKRKSKQQNTLCL